MSPRWCLEILGCILDLWKICTPLLYRFFSAVPTHVTLKWKSRQEIITKTVKENLVSVLRERVLQILSRTNFHSVRYVVH